ncbi:formylglycine-generating enzyme family protein [Nocardia sp.]|uniref:formylglycine-generating enzyme family protein n=1 Tax=Nocardia sp. TaxID=1821 RepID=UPI0026077291|nr:formylglycine-generating enzyme family protein [Nocardia sp.]
MAEDRAQPSCCAPGRGSIAPATGALPAYSATRRSVAAGDVSGMIALPGGEFLMGAEDGSGYSDDGEGPVRPVRLRPFLIDACAVTNNEFEVFTEATGYRTEAERLEWSYVFAGFLPAALRRSAPRPERTPWWCGVAGAIWRHPEGPGSELDGRGDHPVVHVSWNDARAYCDWIGKRLPTEAEWEYAARGGLVQARYPWGDELDPGGEYLCNIWRGSFPGKNTAADGYRGTAPVNAFPPNGFGLYNTCGNVWEWCADRWGTHHEAGTPVDPAGPRTGPNRVIRGGSHMCHDSYCFRYRVAARSSNSPDSSAGHTGFRCALTPGT